MCRTAIRGSTPCWVCSTGVFIAQAAASSFVGAAASRDRGLALGLYATFCYVGGSVGGSVSALFWARWGWPACVLMVVAVQLAVAVVSMTCWSDRPQGQPLPSSRGSASAEM